MNDLDAYEQRLAPLREQATEDLARRLVPRLRAVLRAMAAQHGSEMNPLAEAALALPGADPEAAVRLRGAVSERAWLREQLAALEERTRWITEGVAKETAELERKLRWTEERLATAEGKLEFHARREEKLPEDTRALRKKVDLLTGIEGRLVHERDTYRREARWLHGIVDAKSKEATWRAETMESLRVERDWLRQRLRSARDGRESAAREVRALETLRDALREEVEALQRDVRRAREEAASGGRDVPRGARPAEEGER